MQPPPHKGHLIRLMMPPLSESTGDQRLHWRAVNSGRATRSEGEIGDGPAIRSGPPSFAGALVPGREQRAKDHSLRWPSVRRRQLSGRRRNPGVMVAAPG
jgi:hypothetical protein